MSGQTIPELPSAPSGEYEPLSETDEMPKSNRFRRFAALTTLVLVLAGCAATTVWFRAADTPRQLPEAPRTISLKAETSICEIDMSIPYIKSYCDTNSEDTVLVSNDACSVWFYAYDAHDVDRYAVETCENQGYTGCHVEDRAGSACFSCTVDEFQASWRAYLPRYCAAPTPKEWFMTSDCSAARYLPGQNDPPDGYMLYSYNDEKCPCTGIVGDMRCQIHGCLQYEDSWCWATAILIIAGYYKPNQFPTHDDTGPNCHGLTCQIVGQLHFPDDPGQCCTDKDSCNQGGTGADLVNGLTETTGFQWTYLPQISEELLVQVLQDGNPIIFGIHYPGGGGHLLVIAGTDGNGLFYVHDPFFVRGRGSFESLAYDGLVNYQSPGYPGKVADFGSGTMNQAYVPSQYVSSEQELVLAAQDLASQTLAGPINGRKVAVKTRGPFHSGKTTQ